MKKAIIAVILLSAVAANAGVLRFSARHIKHGSKKAAHGLKKAGHGAKKVLY